MKNIQDTWNYITKLTPLEAESHPLPKVIKDMHSIEIGDYAIGVKNPLKQLRPYKSDSELMDQVSRAHNLGILGCDTHELKEYYNNADKNNGDSDIFELI